MRNAEVHNGSTYREDNSMSAMGVTEVNRYTVGSVLTNSNSISQPLEVKKVSEITKTFLNLLKKFWVFLFDQLVNTTQKCMSVIMITKEE